ncbi:hypothetical protein PsorP6_011470 [Peronosclerospora sorghi]|uniref:Uncharacterized protein n=1 Tax=Peronosclerospora sorghi TaxID=230839 RepID=A0ACC0WJ19_9STRA|nr:hypothetical protein PsorP6_011470 [Peronosclerospora sorghi]
MIASFVGTRSPRQVQTHAQKYYEKVERRLRGLRKDRKKLARPEHRLDEDMMQLCQLAKIKKDPTLANRLRAPLSSPCEMGISLRAIQEQQDTIKDERPPFFSSCEPVSPCTSTDSNSTDSDASLDLSDFDDSCLDYLLQVLSDVDCTDGDTLVTL